MNLILGTAWNCSHDVLQPFFRSLKATKFDGITIVFTNGVNGEFDDTLCIPFYPRNDIPNVSYRFTLYLDFLLANREIVADSKIMLTDLRDVVFQSDPFAFKYPPGLSCFLEDESKTIGSCPFNSPWVINTLGRDVHDNLADKLISCAGVTVGDYDAMIEYLRLMVSFISVQGANDQGAHNGIVHLGLMPNITVYENEKGPVITVGNMRNPKFGSKAAIVHQYDRHPEMIRIVSERFCK